MNMKNKYNINQNSMNNNYKKLECIKNGREDKFNLNCNSKNNKNLKDNLKYNKTYRI